MDTFWQHIYNSFFIILSIQKGFPKKRTGIKHQPLVYLYFFLRIQMHGVVPSKKPKEISYARLPIPNKRTKYTLFYSSLILRKRLLPKKRYVFNDNCLLFSAKYNYSNVLCLWAKCGHQTLFTHKAKNLSFEMFLQRVLLQKQKNI